MSSRSDYNSLVKVLKADGWYLARKGGHDQYKHPFKKGVVTLPRKVNKNIELSVYRQAGLRNNNK